MVDLLDVLGSDVSFKGYCDRDYWVWEREIAIPRLQELGYAVGEFIDGERDSFGPLSRIIRVSKGNQSETLIYG